MRNVMLVFGTRPEAIKMCPLVKELLARPEVETTVCVTGQHRHMLDQVLEAFDVVPDYDLDIMQEGQSLFDITSNILLQIRAVLEEARPDVVLVHGDTSTSFVTALAAFYEQIPVGHVEAGLRTFDIHSPFPEEFNRQGVGIIAAHHFAPTPTARKNLLGERKVADTIHVTGNTVIDALNTTVSESYTHPELEWAADSRLILVTSHRRESLGEPMRQAFRAIRDIVDEVADVKVVYPVHMNPIVQAAADEILEGHERIHLIDPLDVLDFHNFMAAAHIVMSDSGGVQEEAPALGKPVLVLREVTERPEGIAAGTLALVGTDRDLIRETALRLLTDEAEYERMAHAVNPYGDGRASERIADILIHGRSRIGDFEPFIER